MELPHTKSSKETLEFYKVDQAEGLSEARVLELRNKYGYNGQYYTVDLLA